MAYVYYNPNPKHRRTDDCVVRAISKITKKDWHYVYTQLCIRGFIMCDWGNCNEVWGSYLRKIGFERKSIPNTCPDCYTVKDFCKDYPKGKYILACGNHVIAIVDGNHYDTWDSSDEAIIFYWEKN